MTSAGRPHARPSGTPSSSAAIRNGRSAEATNASPPSRASASACSLCAMLESSGLSFIVASMSRLGLLLTQHDRGRGVAGAIDKRLDLGRRLPKAAPHVTGDDLGVRRVGPVDADTDTGEVGAAE